VGQEDVPRYEDLSEFLRSKFSRQDFEAWEVTGYRNIPCENSTVAWQHLQNLTQGEYHVEIEPTEGPMYYLHAFRLGRRGDDSAG
jgi:hypothetical protein